MTEVAESVQKARSSGSETGETFYSNYTIPAPLGANEFNPAEFRRQQEGLKAGTPPLSDKKRWPSRAFRGLTKAFRSYLDLVNRIESGDPIFNRSKPDNSGSFSSRVELGDTIPRHEFTIQLLGKPGDSVDDHYFKFAREEKGRRGITGDTMFVINTADPKVGWFGVRHPSFGGRHHEPEKDVLEIFPFVPVEMAEEYPTYVGKHEIGLTPKGTGIRGERGRIVHRGGGGEWFDVLKTENDLDGFSVQLDPSGKEISIRVYIDGVTLHSYPQATRKVR
ncbi:MAG TPA: hypothetical protein VF810_03830 [Patescibacteria group bacterium]